jgi:hypothetical protein
MNPNCHCSNANEFELAAAFGRICADEFSNFDRGCESQPYARSLGDSNFYMNYGNPLPDLD